MEKKCGVVIANTGSPAAPTPEAVRAYLSEFLSDPRICPMNPRIWRLLLNSVILPRRSVASARKYASIWTDDGSPLLATMESLAGRLESALNATGDYFRVTCAMAYGEPSIASALETLDKAGCDKIVVTPLYPQSAFSTTMVIKDKLDAALDASDIDRERVVFVDSYCDAQEYVDAICASLAESGFGQDDGDRILFAFHSIPLTDIKGGDAYAEQVQDTVSRIAKQLALDDDAWRLGYQCRFDKSRKWLSPSTGSVIDELAGKPGRLFVVAPNFSVDCLETIFDIEVELKERHDTARPHEEFIYVKCLNDSDEQVRLLASIVNRM